MQCNPGCKLNNCNNCPDQPRYYKNPNRLDGKNNDLPDPDDARSGEERQRVIKYLKKLGKYNNNILIDNNFKKPGLLLNSLKDKCYFKNQNECNRDQECFYCKSNAKTKKCYKIEGSNKYVCDNEYVSACMPTVTLDNKLQVETNFPFHRANYEMNINQGTGKKPVYQQQPYNFRKEDINKDGNRNEQVLDYPRKCKGTIRKTISLDDKRAELMKMRDPNIMAKARNFQGFGS